jgi:hypothetical protein
VPAPSSAIPSAMAQLAHHDPLGDAEVGHLLDYLATVSDPRALSGRRHPLVAILALAAAAVLTGARSMAAIAEWAVECAPGGPGGAWRPPRGARVLGRPVRGDHPQRQARSRLSGQPAWPSRPL